MIKLMLIFIMCLDVTFADADIVSHERKIEEGSRKKKADISQTVSTIMYENSTVPC